VPEPVRAVTAGAGRRRHETAGRIGLAGARAKRRSLLDLDAAFRAVSRIETGNIDLASSLKAESGGVVGGRGRGLVRSGLVVAQVALSFVLLVGAGLLFQSLRAVQNTNPAFRRTAC